MYIITFSGNTYNSITENHCQFQVTPIHKPLMQKSVTSPLFIGQLHTDTDSFLVPKQISLLAPHPNPFNSTINIRVTNTQDIESNLEIHDVNGRLIENIPINNNVHDFDINWSADGLPSGVYFIRLNYRNENQLKKVLYLK